MRTLYIVMLVCFHFILSSCNYVAATDSQNTSKISEGSNKIETQRMKDYFINNSQKSKMTSSTNILSIPLNSETKEYNWYFKPSGKGIPPLGPTENSLYKNNNNCIYIGDTTKKYIYLTFDEGYENGYTAPILDTLKKHNIKGAFFVVKPYITSNPELIKRMVAEGHLVCNHSARHPSMATITDKQKFNKELIDVEEAFENLTSQKMPKFFRPPMGKYSELSLKYTKDFGYTTVFWSFAYMDWEPNKQPSKAYAKDKILSRIHNGAIVLLHTVSKTNAEILDEIIVELKNQGYEFKTLYDIK